MKLVLGSAGFIGSAVAKRLPDAIHLPTGSKGLRLDQDASWVNLKGVETVYLCAGRTGGVGLMRKDPMAFVYPNIRIHLNVFEACAKAGVKRVVLAGSTTGYADSPNPMKEGDYGVGELHPAYFLPGNTHRFIKKVSSVQPFEVLIFRPSNVYGPGNNFDPENSHVIEATVRKVAEKHDPFVIWGDGKQVRDAVYVDDLADAMVMDLPPGDYNVGSGEEMDVNQMVDLLLEYDGQKPKIEHDLSKPTAISARRVDCSKLRSFGWAPKVSMESGLKRTLDWYLGANP